MSTSAAAPDLYMQCAAVYYGHSDADKRVMEGCDGWPFEILVLQYSLDCRSHLRLYPKHPPVTTPPSWGREGTSAPSEPQSRATRWAKCSAPAAVVMVMSDFSRQCRRLPAGLIMGHYVICHDDAFNWLSPRFHGSASIGAVRPSLAAVCLLMAFLDIRTIKKELWNKVGSCL